MKKGQHHYHGPHSRYRLQYHLVWISKYRKRVMIGDVASSVRKLFYDCAQMNDWWITRLAVMPAEFLNSTGARERFSRK